MSQILKEPNKIRVKFEELEDIAYWSGGYDTMHYQGKPFNGYAVLDYYLDGSVAFEEEYRDGNHKGWDNEYHENGKLKYSSLNYGESLLISYEYDEEDNLIHKGKSISIDTLERFVKDYNLLDEEYMYVIKDIYKLV